LDTSIPELISTLGERHHQGQTVAHDDPQVRPSGNTHERKVVRLERGIHVTFHQKSQTVGVVEENPSRHGSVYLLTMVNSTNVLDEGLRIGEIGRRMNSKVKLVEIGVYQK
jgi:hypothetical protein